MLDFTFEKVIIAYTVAELMEQLEDVDDGVEIKSEQGIWAGASWFTVTTDTFVDAFDHTVYQHEVYVPTHGEGEVCFGLYRNYGEEYPGYQLIQTAGELKRCLKDEVPPEFKVVSVDDNFELGGAITEKIRMLLIRREGGLTLELR